MTTASNLRKPALRRDRFVLVCVGVWLVGALASRFVDIWIGVGGAAITLGMLTLLRERPLLRSLFIPTPGRLAFGLLGGLAQIAVTYSLYPVVAGHWPWLAQATRELYVTLGATTAIGPLVVIPLVILSEELVWRGVVQESLSLRLSLPASVVATALIYGSCHLPAHPLLPALALICGLYWGAWRTVSGSLITPLIAHLMWDLSVFVLAPLVRV